MNNEDTLLSDILESLARVLINFRTTLELENIFEALSLANRNKGGDYLKLDGTLTPSRFGVEHEVGLIVSCVIKEDYITAHRAAERLQMLLTKA